MNSMPGGFPVTLSTTATGDCGYDTSTSMLAADNNALGIFIALSYPNDEFVTPYAIYRG